jgi:hypothetical protein
LDAEQLESRDFLAVCVIQFLFIIIIIIIISIFIFFFIFIIIIDSAFFPAKLLCSIAFVQYTEFHSTIPSSTVSTAQNSVGGSIFIKDRFRISSRHCVVSPTTATTATTTATTTAAAAAATATTTAFSSAGIYEYAY